MRNTHEIHKNVFLKSIVCKKLTLEKVDFHLLKHYIYMYNQQKLFFSILRCQFHNSKKSVSFQAFIGTLRHKHVLHEVIHQHIYKYE